MVNLRELIHYFQTLAERPSLHHLDDGRIRGLHGFVVDTVDAEVGKKYQALRPDDLPVLSMLLPSAVSTSDDVDALTERNTVVIVVLDKFDPQRKRDAVKVCIDTQPIIEAIKAAMVNDKAAGCHILDRLDLRSFSTMPETGVYGTLAGWSLGFSFETIDCPPEM